MSMPVANVAIWSCPNGTCSSIAKEVCGLTTPTTITLSDLGFTGGFKAPFSMSDFFSYCNFDASPTLITNISAAGCNYVINIIGSGANAFTVTDACTWLTCAPSSGSPNTGINVCVAANAGVARVGCVCFVPSFGVRKDVTFCQIAASAACPLYLTNIMVCNIKGGFCRLDQITGWQNTTDCVNMSFGFGLQKCANLGTITFCVVCNGTCIHGCTCSISTCVNIGSSYIPRVIDGNDSICLWTRVQQTTITYASAEARLAGLTSISGFGCYCVGSPYINRSCIGISF